MYDNDPISSRQTGASTHDSTAAPTPDDEAAEATLASLHRLDSPHGYIIRRRVERAQGLMLSTARPLRDIAAECGLADQAHLTRLFRRIVGESPAAWRRARIEPIS
jgi:AraC-like DNA-binding protein